MFDTQVNHSEYREREMTRIANVMLDRYAKKAIWHIKRMHKDRHMFESYWEEYKFYVQERSPSADCELELRRLCHSINKKIPYEELMIMWLWSDLFINEDEDNLGGLPLDSMESLLYWRVELIAIDEERKSHAI